MSDTRVVCAIIVLVCFCLSLLLICYRISQRCARSRDVIVEAQWTDPLQKFTVCPILKVPGNSTAYYLGDTKNDLLAVSSFNAVTEPSEGHILTSSFELRGVIKGPIGQNPEIRLRIYLNDRLASTNFFPLVANGREERAQLSIVQGGLQLPTGAVPTEGEIEIKTSHTLPLRSCRRGRWTCIVEIYTGQDVGEKRLTGFEARTWIEGLSSGHEVHDHLDFSHKQSP